MIKVKRNEQLMEKFKNLYDRLQVWQTYVYSDYEFSPDELKQFSETTTQHIEEMQKMKNEFFQYFVKCHKENNGKK